MQNFTFINTDTDEIKVIRAENYGNAMLLLGQEVIELEGWTLAGGQEL